MIIPTFSHFCFITISAAFGRLTPARPLVAHHSPAAAIVVLIAATATIAIDVAINVAAAANSSSAAACS